MVNKKFMMGILVLVLVLVFGFCVIGCASLNATLYGSGKPDVSKAVNPDGISINTNNCAYIVGPVLEINDKNIPHSQWTPDASRITRVPVGEELDLLISFGVDTHQNLGNGQTRTEQYRANGKIKMPPLEKDRVYRIRTTGSNPDLMERRLLTYFNIQIQVYNTSTDKYDHLVNHQINVSPPKGPER